MQPIPQSGVIDTWLQWGATELDHAIAKNRQEAEWLLSALLNCNRSNLLLKKSDISKDQSVQFMAWIDRRKKGEPAQYISGWTEFYSRKFHCDTAVLVPRQETERLVDVALHTCQGVTNPNIVDIGTGSGCVAISIAAELPHTEVTGIDISNAALVVAENNAVLHQIKNVHFLPLDFFQYTPDQPLYQCLVMNPPYIPLPEMETLLTEVRNYEPVMALTDQHDGLTFYRHLAQNAHKWVVTNGWLIMEVGRGDHPQKAAACFASAKHTNLELISDFNSDNRVLKVQLV